MALKMAARNFVVLESAVVTFSKHFHFLFEGFRNFVQVSFGCALVCKNAFETKVAHLTQKVHILAP